MRSSILEYLAIGLVWAILILWCIVCSGCGTAKPVPVVERKDSIVVRTETRIDSIFRDRWHTVRQKGDTVFVRDSVFLTRYKILNRQDTVRVKDSVPYPVEVIREIRRRNGYDRFVSWGFWSLLAVIAPTLVICLRYRKWL